MYFLFAIKEIASERKHTDTTHRNETVNSRRVENIQTIRIWEIACTPANTSSETRQRVALACPLRQPSPGKMCLRVASMARARENTDPQQTVRLAQRHKESEKAQESGMRCERL